MPYPNITSWLESWQPGDEKYATQIIESYAAQLYLRKHLNKIHRIVYSDSASSVDLKSMLQNLDAAQSRVGSLEWLPPNYRFNEDDQPAGDILSARLRAKYWGAQSITYRPCIKMILDLSFNLRRKNAGSTSHMEYQTEDEVSPDIVREVKSLGDDVWNHARKGVRALIESTQAFHGLGDQRPIITNVFGTAHA